MKALFAIVIGLIGLAMSTCGLVFVIPLARDGGGQLVLIAAAAIGVGGLLLWWAVRLWQSWQKAKTPH